MDKDTNKIADHNNIVNPFDNINIDSDTMANYWLMFTICVVIFKHMDFNVLEYLGIEYLVVLIVFYLFWKYYYENYNTQSLKV
ncbi:hypothetical protein AN639_01160 [Candidatus Epulonipiscium fishelsonii]|uniref:Uncharacterized protein n=1 Tax=Candidatus Epulonipiscium fishelsonii TaxID=77094 RepID=A0ACC8X7K4_9FIRM|nr:hypothetical protein AN396_12085 [Epulopiscium sp. SCG-B11WGA-EpuloA1]ONI40717.1 hypothetical protein AN639_01160 [Epulopiscium sp. SCG-B05WGA-EpuloA1]